MGFAKVFEGTEAEALITNCPDGSVIEVARHRDKNIVREIAPEHVSDYYKQKLGILKKGENLRVWDSIGL